MEFFQLVAAAEAILFASGEPVRCERIALALEIGSEETEEVLSALAAKLETENSGLRLIRLGEKAQLCTRGEYAACIRVALETRKPPALSQAAMEVLAIAAYRQPVTRAYIEQVRGVDSAYTVSSLVEKGFLEESGRLEVPGRPALFRTTDQFLRVFGLTSLAELTPLPTEGEDGQLKLPNPELEALANQPENAASEDA
ncbi:MAG: SMC-Scp complex subunit ScpB [Clostridiales bacterium]|nr:SMC-Scp complex subunit ScpB [Clostridiales bacterium]MDD7310592.1 SMC-Scp complex subunit ScpB [Eubacteriales bacterium]MDY5346421.1 SMC-Scp complex subunit ScpB [Eubacteriales bacterium]